MIHQVTGAGEMVPQLRRLIPLGEDLRSVPVTQVRQPGTLGCDGLFWLLRTSMCVHVHTGVLRYIWNVRPAQGILDPVPTKPKKEASMTIQWTKVFATRLECQPLLDSHGGWRVKTPCVL